VKFSSESGGRRSALAEKSVRAMTFVVTHVTIVSSPCSAMNVLSHRSAGKSSWKRAVSCEGGVTGHGVDLDMFFSTRS